MQNLWVAGLFFPVAKRTAESPSLFGTELDYRSEIWKLLYLFPLQVHKAAINPDEFMLNDYLGILSSSSLYTRSL